MAEQSRLVDIRNSELTDDYVEETKLSWMKIQDDLKTKLIVGDTEDWQAQRILALIAGMDMSFSKDNSSIAVCSLVICSIPDLKVVYEDSIIVTLTMPYIPGFLAFREVEHYLKVYQKLIENKPELTPQVVLVDGNGILHPRGFGLASHFGVLANTCTIGVAKNLHHLGDNIMRDDFHLAQIEALKEAGDRFLLENTHETIGAALKTTKEAKRPIYVSVGHKISLETALWTVMCCIDKYRIPEPVRQADIRSRVAVTKLF